MSKTGSNRATVGLRAQWRCYYDGYCGFCNRVVIGLRRLDLLNRVAWIPYQSLKEPPEGLSWEELEASVVLESGKGVRHRGFYAFRRLAAVIFPLWPMLPLLWFPGVRLLGEPLYERIARNRCSLFGCRVPESLRPSDETDGSETP